MRLLIKEIHERTLHVRREQILSLLTTVLDSNVPLINNKYTFGLFLPLSTIDKDQCIIDGEDAKQKTTCTHETFHVN